jgi:hypothetical protein
MANRYEAEYNAKLDRITPIHPRICRDAVKYANEHNVSFKEALAYLKKNNLPSSLPNPF